MDVLKPASAGFKGFLWVSMLLKIPALAPCVGKYILTKHTYDNPKGCSTVRNAFHHAPPCVVSFRSLSELFLIF